MSTENHQDIKRDSFVVRFLPAPLRPFALLARLDRPVGVWLLLLPSLWGIVLAGRGQVWDVRAMVLFAIGAIVMRSAGCVVNDIWDRKLDVQVERTRTRPLAAGDISVFQALVFLAVLLAIGLAVLLQFNFVTILLGILAVPLVGIYPLMKRVTWWPQAFLGLVFNFGALMGWSAVTGGVSVTAICLYGAGILWTLAYDTIYAYQDIEDDALVGVKSTARLFGEKHQKRTVYFYYGSWALAAIAVEAYDVFFMLPALAYILWIFKGWEHSNPQSCLLAFQRSRNYGLLLLFGFVLAAIQIA